MLQKTLFDAPSLPGYRVYTKAPVVDNGSREIGTVVRKHAYLAKLMHWAVRNHREAEVGRIDKYLPVTPAVENPSYRGVSNESLARGIAVEEVRTALHELKGKSVAGLERVTTKALRNLNDDAIEKLTEYSSAGIRERCQSSGRRLGPSSFQIGRAAKYGQPPPILLTSCVGKVMGRILMNRWQDDLERLRLYPVLVTGFRKHLSTQVAVILLKNEIVDDKVKAQGNKPSRAILHLQEKWVGSMGTPQRSVISPLMFSLVMIGGTEWLENIEGVSYTIYAHDIMLLVPGGSDADIEGKLQEAIDAIEDQLDSSDSPSKSDLLAIPQNRADRTIYKPRGFEIKVVKRSGQMITEVGNNRALDMVVEKQWRKGETVPWLTAKVADAIRLVKRSPTAT
ncbi:uncharacterized protein LOC144163739 [Haemaphysalis longicornis]